jgi:hypothetical protein
VIGIASRLAAVDQRLSDLDSLAATDASALAPLLAARAAVRQSERRIVFFGAFKSGKSTLLNALIGAPVLPMRANRATGVVVSVQAGGQLAATVRLLDGSERAIEPDDISRYVLLDTSGDCAVAPREVAEVRITVPVGGLVQPWVLVDTAGLLDDAALTARTYAELERADLAVMVLSADKLLAAREKDAAQRVGDLLGGNVVFVVNRLELLDEDERDEVLGLARRGLAGLGNLLVGLPPIFACQSRTALQARLRGRAVASDTGVSGFRAWLDGLTGGPVGDDMMSVARLSGLLRQVSAVQPGCVTSIDAARTARERAQANDAARRAQEQRALEAQAERARAELAAIRSDLNTLAGQMVADAADGARAVLATDMPSLDKLDAAIQASQTAFAARVSERAKESLAEIGLSPGDLQLAPVPDALATAGIILPEEIAPWFDLGRNVVAESASWLSGAVLGAATGLKAIGADPTEAILDQVRSAAREQQPRLLSEAQAYLAEAQSMLATTLEQGASQATASAELLAAQAAEQKAEQDLAWCKALEAEVRSALAG